jgi:hypothetical protein
MKALGVLDKFLLNTENTNMPTNTNDLVCWRVTECLFVCLFFFFASDFNFV